MSNFIKLNLNPKQNKTNDCAVRAIAYITNTEWSEVFDALCALARKEAKMPNDISIIERYLEAAGFIKHSCKAVAGRRRKTVSQIAAESTKLGIVRVAHHIVAIDGKGNYVDTWDCGNKCAYTLWIKV